MSETTEREADLSEASHNGASNEHIRRLYADIAKLTNTVNDLSHKVVRERQRADRAERILAALALAREAVVEAAAAAYTKCKADNEWFFTHHIGISFALLAAVAAAEREVDA